MASMLKYFSTASHRWSPRIESSSKHSSQPTTTGWQTSVTPRPTACSESRTFRYGTSLAVAEAERARKRGLRGVLLPTVPGRETSYSLPADHQYDDRTYERLWSALEDLDMPAHIHVDGVPLAPEFASDTIVLMCVNKTMMCEPITVLACSGVFERHPRLKFVAVESGIGWLAWFLPWMDLVFERHRFYTGYDLQAPTEFLLPPSGLRDVHPRRTRDPRPSRHWR
jgi:hypothetical protein